MTPSRIFLLGSSACVWEENPAALFRSITPCDEISRRTIRHEGWYLPDYFHDEVARGCVLALTHGRFAAGILDPHNDGPCVVCVSESFDTALDAALLSDELARHYADNAWDAEAKFQSEQEAEDLKAADAAYEECAL